MSSKMRRQVLEIFKKLHRTRQTVFAGDIKALSEGRTEINKHFRKNREVCDPTEIKQMLKLAQDVDKELRTNVIQAVKHNPNENVYQMRITEDIVRLDNMPFNENAVIERPKRRAPKGCLSAKEEAKFEAELAESKKKCAQQEH